MVKLGGRLRSIDKRGPSGDLLSSQADDDDDDDDDDSFIHGVLHVHCTCSP